jgi:hypothetical protein
MTNFEKIVQGGPEAVIAYAYKAFCETCIHGDTDCRKFNTPKCREGRLAWLNSPAKPTLTEDEEVFVRWALDFGFEWAARDRDGSICVFSAKPYKDYDCGQWAVNVNMRDATYSGPLQINFIHREDTEPVYLPDLVKGGKGNE